MRDRILPSPAERDALAFYVAKNLPYRKRITLALTLFLVGAGLQIATLGALAGLPFLLVAVLLVAVKGYDSRARLKGFDIDPAWKPVPIERIQELEELRRRAKRWDRDAFEVSNPLGCAVFLLLTTVLLFVAVVGGVAAGDVQVSLILLLDGFVMVGLLWFTGMRRLLTLPNLAVRAQVVLELHRAFEKLGLEGETFQPALRLARGRQGGVVPTDVRFSVRFPRAPEGFWGLQGQININLVQGTSYPYFYCVLAARPGFGLDAYQPRIPLPPKVICEYQPTAEAEVLVIRQETTRTSGYHTDRKARERIFGAALAGGRAVCTG